MKRHILTGIRHGLWVWLVYGIVEFTLACGLPLLFEPEVELLGWQLRSIALLFGVYALCGLVLGGAGGVLLAWTGRHKDSSSGTAHQITTALTLVVAFVANLIQAWPLQASEYVALAIAVMLAVAFIGALASSVWLERVAFLANSCAVSLLLLIIPWISRVALIYRSTTLKTGLSVLLVGAVILLAALWHRLRSGQMDTLRRRAIIAGTATLLLMSGVVLSGRPWTVRANQGTRSLQSGKPNVILITMDTVRADHLSLYGYERDTAPHLRDFARQATLYTHAIATSDWTLATHASIFTGLYPGWHHAHFAPPHYRWGRPLAPRYTTLAEVLRAHGYWTAAEVANYGFLSPSLGLTKGFSEYHSRRPIRLVQMPWERRPFYLRESARRVLSLAGDTPALDGNVLRAEDINRGAFELLDRATHNEQPFFLFLNYMDAHGPYVLPSPFDTRFPGRDRHFNRVSGHIRLTLGVNSGQRHISAVERRHLISQYDGAIAYEDEVIGSLLARLHELGCYDNTLIIITSDHGELFGKHDLMGHNVGSVYQDLVHVPLLVKYPGQHEGRQSDTLVSQVDLMPTVLNFAGISPPSGVQGQSLRLPRADSDAVYSEAIAVTYLVEMNPRFQGVRRGIFAGPWKLITWTKGPPELYDLRADPDETRNLYRTDDPRAKALERQLSAWAAAAPKELEQPDKLDKNSVEQLKSLGYAQ